MKLAAPLKYTGLAGGAALLIIAGCAVGPNFKTPPPPKVSGYLASPVTNIAAVTNISGGDVQRFVPGADIPAQWWALFHNKPLNDLVEQAIKASPDLKAAQAALRGARENVLSQQGAYYPSVSGSFNAQRAKTSSAVSPATFSGNLYYSFYSPAVAVSYSPDVFGLNRRTVESLDAQAQQQRFALMATYLTLTANVVGTAIQEAALRAQISATRDLIDINKKALGILHFQFEKGYVSQLDVAAQETQLAQLAATLPPLAKQLAQERDLLAVLTGAFPSQQPRETFELSSLQLPRDLPLSLPAKLVEQRPDVRQAEENMHSASAQIGIAIANRLPNIALTANVGDTALTMNDLFSPGTAFWGVAGTVTQPIFEGGALLHKQRAAQAAFDQAAEQYRSTVLGAFQNVADTLNALEQDGNALKTAAEAERAAKTTLDMTRKQQKAGYVSDLALITAETAYQQADITLVQAQASRFADSAALFQALGGGWWNRKDLTKE